MRSEHDPADCLPDIVENIERIESYMRGLDRDGFRKDGRSRDADIAARFVITARQHPTRRVAQNSTSNSSISSGSLRAASNHSIISGICMTVSQ